jgi:hypothetical protein
MIYIYSWMSARICKWKFMLYWCRFDSYGWIYGGVPNITFHRGERVTYTLNEKLICFVDVIVFITVLTQWYVYNIFFKKIVMEIIWQL